MGVAPDVERVGIEFDRSQRSAETVDEEASPSRFRWFDVHRMRAASQRLVLTRSEIEYRDLQIRRVEHAASRCDREQHGSPTRQIGRIHVRAFAALHIGVCDQCGLAAGGRHRPQPDRGS